MFEVLETRGTPADVRSVEVDQVDTTNVNVLQLALIAPTAPWVQIDEVAERLVRRLEGIPGVSVGAEKADEFKAAGARIIAHRAAREYLQSDTARLRLEASRQELAPWVDAQTRLLDADDWLEADKTLTVGGVPMQIRHAASPLPWRARSDRRAGGHDERDRKSVV